MTIEPKWDDIDNRNMQMLRDTVTKTSANSCDKPDAWPEVLRNIVLFAMRRAGDEALLDQVSVRLERSFGSTRDVRAGAVLVTEYPRHLSDKPEVIDGCECAICQLHRK